jgi:O-methyltransferase involved in polyketide biosynthesis
VFERTPAAISPTAHYTGEVWRRNGLSHPALVTLEGRVLHAAMRPVLAFSSALGGPTMEPFLLARHRLIDSFLDEAIEAGEIGQVIEIAAGMSPRGLRMTERHPDLIYIEADLPAMAARKRDALAHAGASHRVADLDALAEDGPDSLAQLAAGLDADLGTAVVTEGLINYFPRAAVDGIWARIATALRRFPAALYVSDLHLESENSEPVARAWMAALGAFVRGRVYMPYHDEADALGALRTAGFERAELHRGGEAGTGRGADRVRVIEARTGQTG